MLSDKRSKLDIFVKTVIFIYHLKHSGGDATTIAQFRQAVERRPLWGANHGRTCRETAGARQEELRGTYA